MNQDEKLDKEILLEKNEENFDNNINNKDLEAPTPNKCPVIHQELVSKENAVPGEELAEKPKKCLFVELNPDVTYFNMSTFYLVQFSYVSAFTFIDACQDHLLESDIYNIDKDKVGSINGDILLFDTLYLIAFIYVYGAFHDIFGRKILIVFGFLSMALSLFLYPLAGSVYPNLILVR